MMKARESGEGSESCSQPWIGSKVDRSRLTFHRSERASLLSMDRLHNDDAYTLEQHSPQLFQAPGFILSLN